MGVSIWWSLPPKQHDITPGARSEFNALLERGGVYGEQGVGDIGNIAHLAAFCGDNETRLALVAIIKAIEKHGTIIVGRDY